MKAREARGEARGKRAGRNEGIKQGREDALLSTARRMKASGLTDAQIVEFTGLSLDELGAL